MRYLRSKTCLGCLLGKHSRLPMTGTINHDVKQYLDMWIFDTMVPNMPTRSGNRYITLIMDVYSGYLIVIFTKTKGEITEQIINIIKQQQTQHQRTLKIAHSDNAKELDNNIMNSFLTNQGTRHTTSIAFTPQHNPVERHGRTFLETTKAMMHHAGSPPSLYGHAGDTAIFHRNRSINSHSHTMTAYEVVTHVKPDLTHIHVWGCDAYYHTFKHKREHKFSANCKVGIFIGYDDDNERYYRILNVDDNIVILSRDVIFKDHEFNQMKRLKQQYDEHETTDTGIQLSIDDYLPDTMFRSPQLTTDLFSQEQTRATINQPNTSNQQVATKTINQGMTHSPSSVKDSLTTTKTINQGMTHSPSGVKDSPKTNNQGSQSNDRSNIDRSNIDRSNNTNNNDQLTTPTRHSSRITARPFRHDPSAYATAVTSEPTTYKQAIESDNSIKWQAAMKDELDAHNKNRTWSLVERTPDMNVIGSKWVYKIKIDEHGNISKFKARVVAKGYDQEEGVDYMATFSPVLMYKSKRLVISLSVLCHAHIRQYDVKTAFLNATVKETIYVKVPEGMNAGPNQVLRLNKALYGIKQAPREWHIEIDTFIKSLGYQSCIKDTCLYYKQSRTRQVIIIGIFVDDILSMFNDNDKNEWYLDEQKLKAKYDISDLGDLHHILGMRVTKQSNGDILVDQQTYLRDKLQQFGMDQSRDIATPEEITKKPIGETQQLDIQGVKTYQAMVGSLIYASYSTRPDITHATNMVARHMKSPTTQDMVKAKRLFRYLQGTQTLGLLYKAPSQHQGGELIITGYCDADWAGDTEDRKSTTGYCTFINNNLIDWQCKKQTTVALSSTEAEYMAISEVTKEVMWLKAILTELKQKVMSPIIIYVDNQSAIKISENPTAHHRTKHIDIRHHFIRNAINDGISSYSGLQQTNNSQTYSRRHYHHHHINQSEIN